MINPEDIVVNEAYLRLLIDLAKRRGADTAHLELALERIRNGKDWRTGEDA